MNLSNRVLHKSYIEQVDLYYGSAYDLSFSTKEDDDSLKKGEKILNPKECEIRTE